MTRYNLEGINLYFNPGLLREFEIESLYNYKDGEIILRTRHLCRRRLFTLLHEICHALQHKEGRLVSRSLKKRYMIEFEAEMFAIEEYEKLYSKKYGSCLSEPWTLDTYEGYQKYYQAISKRR